MCYTMHTIYSCWHTCRKLLHPWRFTWIEIQGVNSVYIDLTCAIKFCFPRNRSTSCGPHVDSLRNILFWGDIKLQVTLCIFWHEVSNVIHQRFSNPKKVKSYCRWLINQTLQRQRGAPLWASRYQMNGFKLTSWCLWSKVLKVICTLPT